MSRRLCALLILVALSGVCITAASGQVASPAASPAPAKAGEAPPAAAATPTTPAAKAKPKAPLVPARKLFGAVATPAPMEARAIGFYSRGCLAGAKPLAIDGPAWQAMRLSRNRTWGHPNLIRLVQRLATDAKANDGWPGLLVGDLSQPRGGPMLTGHASHQIGLDADIWLTPMPDRRLSEKEREDLSATSMLGSTPATINPAVWTPAHVRLIKRAATYSEVERVLVHPAIKKALCDAAGSDRAWLGKVRPYWGHHYHMHIRISCPKGSTGCEAQKPPAGDDGCGKEVEDWLKLLSRPPKPEPPGKPKPPERPLTLDRLPPECRVVLQAGRKAVGQAPIPGSQDPKQ